MISGRVVTALSDLQDKHNDIREGGHSTVRPAGQEQTELSAESENGTHQSQPGRLPDTDCDTCDKTSVASSSITSRASAVGYCGHRTRVPLC